MKFRQVKPPIDWFPPSVKTKSIQNSMHLCLCEVLQNFKSKMNRKFPSKTLMLGLRNQVFKKNPSNAEMAELDWRFALTKNARTFADLSITPDGFSKYLSQKGLVGFGLGVSNEQKRYFATRSYYCIDALLFQSRATKLLFNTVTTHYPEGVDLIVADDDGLCSLDTGFPVLKEGGTFVCKFVDDFTEISEYVLKNMHRAFKRITIIKLVANEGVERFVVCKGKCVRHDKDTMKAFMDYLARSKDKIIKNQCSHALIKKRFVNSE
jgi:23S rRNA U2552 (ribose-2'-O)-methylase RlmE/FtsJ